jgi:hypothetical protein
MSHANKEVQVLSRRAALKALAAATGAVAISSLPSKWETPVIEVGALPAHAAISCRTPPIGATGSLSAKAKWGDNTLDIDLIVIEPTGEYVHPLWWGGNGPTVTHDGDNFVDYDPDVDFESASVPAGGAATGTYTIFVEDFTGDGATVTVTITTECGTATFTRTLSAANDFNQLVADITFPGGTCVERSGPEHLHENGEEVAGASHHRS